MLRGMVFIDHFNFDIAAKNLFKQNNCSSPRLDYEALPRFICNQLPNIDLVKTMLFIAKPDEFLMHEEYIKKAYEWASNLQNKPFFDVIEGRYLSRPTEGRTKDIEDKSSYFKIEKGTDTNLAIHAISKAFFNSYDIGFFVSADTDYINMYSILKSIGKLAVVVSVAGQNIRSIIPYVDKNIILNLDQLMECQRADKPMPANGQT